jgi:hypothetical protein
LSENRKGGSCEEKIRVKPAQAIANSATAQKSKKRASDINLAAKVDGERSR